MKTKEELNALKEEVKTLNRKLAELNEEELAQVTGGTDWDDLGDYLGWRSTGKRNVDFGNGGVKSD